jgi:DNA-binding transcriptional LysR family regulator
MIELRSLRQFVAVAEELHFGRAATRLHMTQPPLTQAIQKLEQALGAVLFERSSRRVVLTPAGLALQPLAQQLVTLAHELPPRIQAAAQGQVGRLRLGFVSTVGYGELPRWLRGFREAQPGIAVQLLEATLDLQLEAFARQDMDAGFVIHAPGAVPAGLASISVGREPLMLALSAEEPLARGDVLQPVDVLDLPLVMFPREVAPSLFDAVMQFYQTHQRTPRLAQQATQMQTIVNLVSAGMGAAWVPASVSSLQRPGVVYRTVAGLPPMCETSLVWLPDARPTVDRFVAHVRAMLQQHPVPG